MAVLQFSSAVGDPKDIGQTKEFLADALLNSGEVQTKQSSIDQADNLVKGTLSDLDIYKKSQKQFEELKKQQVLAALQSELKSCRKRK